MFLFDKFASKFKNWSLKRQLIFAFFLAAIILELIIFVIILVFLTSIKTNTTRRITTEVLDKVLLDMESISMHGASIFARRKEEVESFLNHFKLILDETLEENIPYIITSSETYEELYDLKKNDPGYFIDHPLGIYKDPISFNKSTIFIGSKPTANLLKSESLKELIKRTAQLDRILPSYFAPYRDGLAFYRMNMAFESQLESEEVLRTYPANKIISNYTLRGQDGSWFLKTTNSEEGELISHGPYKDEKGSPFVLISFSLKYKTKMQVIGLQVELLALGLESLFKDLNFLQSGVSALVTRSGSLFYFPKAMRFSEDISKRVNDSQYTSYTGMTKQNWNSIINSENYIGVLHNVKMLEWDVLKREKMIDAYIGYVLLTWNEVNGNKTKNENWTFALLLYLKSDEIYHIGEKVNYAITRQSTVIMFISMICVIGTLALVICTSYWVSSRIARPLKKMSIFASMIDKNGMLAEGDLFERIQNELNQGDYQIGELTKHFKYLMAKLDYRKISKDQDDVIGKKTVVNYPHNEYNLSYLAKTKTNAVIDWQWAIEELQNDFDRISRSASSEYTDRD